MKCLCNKKSGYTLIEFAIIFLVIGVLLSTFAMAYNIYVKKTALDTTSSNMSAVTQSIGNYLIQQGKYPCPARADVDRSSPDYGLEGDCTDTSVAVGSCSNGICIEESERAVGGAAAATKDIVAAGAGLPAWLLNTWWMCGTVACNYPQFLTYAYTDDPSLFCPNATDTMILSGFDVCTVDGMVNYFNAWGWTNWFIKQTIPVTVAVAPRIRRGVVPFRTLNLPEEVSEDGFHMKLDYAVTEPLAVATTYRKEEGGISILDSAGTSLVSPAASAHFVVVSHGEDKKGAYTRYGKRFSVCPAGTVDSENCNTAADNKAKYSAAAMADQAGANHSDDFVQYYTAVDTPLWKVSDASGLHIRDLVDAGTPSGGKIGISSNAPTRTLDVAGDMKSRANLLVDELCDPATDCFTPDKITGNKPEMNCTNPAHPSYDATKPYVVGISGGKVQCAGVVDFKCPAGQMMTGITGAGALTCQTIVPCPARNITVCAANDASLPVGLQGQNESRSAGASRTANYQCQSGAWTLVNTTGVCTCTPSVVNATVACSSVLGSGFTGSATTTTTTTCPSGTVTTSNDTTACSCTPTSETRFNSCAVGFVGGTTDQRDWTCSTATTGSWGAWYYIGGTCTCNPSSESRTLTCPTAYTGLWQQQRNFTCPAGTWTGWADTVNTCSCTGASETQTVACGTGLIGTKTQSRNYDCATNVWSAWADVNTSGCSAATYKWKDKTAPVASGTKGPGPQRHSICTILGDTSACWGYNSSGGYNNYPSCACE